MALLVRASWDNLVRGTDQVKSDALQLRIALVGSDPLIWRRVVVPERITLAELHRLIQLAMGWLNCHLHHFEIGGSQFTEFDEDIAAGAFDSREVNLCDLGMNRKGWSFHYLYDFGDDWLHEILVEDRVETDDRSELPVCVAGARACPPEDSGGVRGYRLQLAIRDDPAHPEREAWGPWLPADFDPEAFDVDSVNLEIGRAFGGTAPGG